MCAKQDLERNSCGPFPRHPFKSLVMLHMLAQLLFHDQMFNDLLFLMYLTGGQGEERSCHAAEAASASFGESVLACLLCKPVNMLINITMSTAGQGLSH